MDDIGPDDIANIFGPDDIANIFGGMMMINETGGEESQTSSVVEAIENDDREGALRLISEGADPFATKSGWAAYLNGQNDITAVHLASGKADIDLLLELVAKPEESTRIQRFVLSRKTMMNVPKTGRECVKTASTNTGNFFRQRQHTSFEGLEVLTMFGYCLKPRDFEYSIIPLSFLNPSNLSLLKFGLAIAGTADKKLLNLDICLGMAIGGYHTPFINGKHPTSIEIASVLLKYGANVNGYCFQGETPYDYVPAVFQAIRNGDVEMTKLLIEYGADVSMKAQFTSWTDEKELDIEEISIQTAAKEANMTECLIPPHTIMVADREAYIKKLRREFESPLRRRIAEHGSILVVAIMRATGCAPLGLVSRLMMKYCPIEFNLWKLDVKSKP